MKLDIVLEHPNPDGQGSRRIVIDTKFTSVTEAGYYRATTLKSDYVYQIYAYLMSQAATGGREPFRGLMLHPVIDGRLTRRSSSRDGASVRHRRPHRRGVEDRRRLPGRGVAKHRNQRSAQDVNGAGNDPGLVDPGLL